MIDGKKSAIINILKNLIRTGKVSSINYDKGKVKVTFPDKDNIVSDELPYLSFEYNMPEIGDTVLCIFLGNGIARGFCLGVPFNKNNLPVKPGKRYYYKNIKDEAFFEYDTETKTFTLSAQNIKLSGEVNVTGNLTVGGNISTDGSISAVGDISTEGNISAQGNITAVGTVDGSNI